MFDTNEWDFIDLSHKLGPHVSEAVPVALDRMDHQSGGAHLAELVGVRQEALTGGAGWASERVSAITHSSTHVDAPHHYSPMCGVGRSRTIDEMPLDWFFGKGICIKLDTEREDAVGLAELVKYLDKLGHKISSGDIVLFRTGAEEKYGMPNYNDYGRGLSPEVVRFLVDSGVRLLGTDAWSIDPPFWKMKEVATEMGSETIWSAHYVGREMEFCAIEKLTNLASLPELGFFVSCFPVKVAGGSAGWARAVAMVRRS